MAFIAVSLKLTDVNEQIRGLFNPADWEGFTIRVRDVLHRAFAHAAVTTVQVEVLDSPHPPILLKFSVTSEYEISSIDLKNTLRNGH